MTTRQLARAITLTVLGIAIMFLIAVGMLVDYMWHTRDQLSIPQFTDEQNEQICIEEEIY